MVSELALVVAYAFRTQGREALTRVELKQLLSLRLNWYPPAEAAQLLERALRAGLLVEDGQGLRPGFDPASLEVPLGFRGSRAALEEPLAALPAAGGAGPGPTGAPGGPGAAADPAARERARALRGLADERLSEPAALLLARRERGEDVAREAAEALSTLSAPR